MPYRREWFLFVSYGTVLAFSWQKDILLAGFDNFAKLSMHSLAQDLRERCTLKLARR